MAASSIRCLEASGVFQSQPTETEQFNFECDGTNDFPWIRSPENLSCLGPGGSETIGAMICFRCWVSNQVRVPQVLCPQTGLDGHSEVGKWVPRNEPHFSGTDQKIADDDYFSQEHTSQWCRSDIHERID